jgi:hypothetical protein
MSRYAAEMTDRSDALKRNLKRYIDSGSALSASFAKMSRSDLEHALRGLTQPGSDARDRVDDLVEDLRARSRRGAEQIVDLVRGELQRELDAALSKRREDLADLAERAIRLAGAVIGYATGSGDHTDGDAASPTAAAPPKPQTAANKRPAAATAAKKTTGTAKAARPTKAAAPKATGAKAAPKRAAKTAAPTAAKSAAKKSGATRRATPGASAAAKKAATPRATPSKRTTT